MNTLQENSNNETLILEQEILKKQIDQLHNAVNQMSSFCFEIKKFYIRTLFVILSLTLAITKQSLDSSIFIITYITTFCFWILDSTAYYYQVKLRALMDLKFGNLRSNIKINNSQIEYLSVQNEDTIEDKRVNRSIPRKLIDATINYC